MSIIQRILFNYLLDIIGKLYYSIYDDLVLNLEPYITYMESVARDLLSFNKDLTIADLGCGTGNLVIFLRKQGINIKSYICVDLLRYNLKRAWKKYKKYYGNTSSLLLILADLTELELYFDNIDAIAILNVLEHLNNPLDFLDEILRRYINSKCRVIYLAFPEEAISRFEEKKRYLMKYAFKLLKHKPYLIFHFLIAYIANILFKYRIKNILLEDIIKLVYKYGCKYRVLSKTMYMTVLKIERG